MLTALHPAETNAPAATHPVMAVKNPTNPTVANAAASSLLARDALDRAGFSREGSPAAFADRAYLDRHDIVVTMTREHASDVRRRLSNDTTQVVLLRNLLDPGKNLDLADPYYGDDAEFDECLELIRAGGQRLTSALRSRLDAGSSEE